MRTINYYKTWAEIRKAFFHACENNGLKPTAKNYRAYINGLRLMHFTNL